MSVNTLKKLLNETSDKLTPQLFKRCHELRDKFKFIQEKKTRTEQEVALKKYKLDNMAIKIKPENVGSFTAYCKSKGYGGVTEKCISQGKNSSSTAIRKKATFAKNARGWNK